MVMLVLTSLASAGLKKAVEHFYFHDTLAAYVSNTCIRKLFTSISNWLMLDQPVYVEI